MTTAARPTFDPAKGGSGVREKSLGKLSQQVSSRDLPAHLTLKERAVGQDTIDEVKQRDLRAELEEREEIARLERTHEERYKFVPSLEQATQVRLALKAERDRVREAERDALLEGKVEAILDDNKLNIVNARKMAQLDADEDFGSDEFSESDLDDDDDDGIDTVELEAELARLRQIHQEEEEKKQQEIREKQEQIRSSEPETRSSFNVKRRWDDDVPFKNCARDEPDPKRKLYVNDTLRQEFHKKFMDRYIR